MLETVDLLVRVRAKVDKVDVELKLIRWACKHEDERVGTAPAGSFTAEYWRCKVCGREWADDWSTSWGSTTGSTSRTGSFARRGDRRPSRSTTRTTPSGRPCAAAWGGC